MQKYILSVLVQNNAGVLARVSSLFGRRGYNIDSLTVSATADPKVSRMSIVVMGDVSVLQQIIKHVSKLEEVIWVDHLWEEECYCRELLFVKVHAEDVLVRDSVREIAELYNATVLDAGKESLILELTDFPSRIDAFLTVLSNYNIVEACRSGVTAMTK